MFYHAVNYGVEKRMVFIDDRDLNRFVALLDYYRFKNPPTRFSFRKRPAYAKKNGEQVPLVEPLAFCLMPDHFHILLNETYDHGINSFLSLVSNSYTKYFNARYKRAGPLFRGTFRSAPIDEANIAQVSRHIHLDPVLSNVVFDLNKFPFSSFQEYIGQKDGFCEKKYILENFGDSKEYEQFVLNRQDYQNTKQAHTQLYLE